MNLDRDLREALKPLGGDPIDDAARALDALPPARPAAPATPLPIRHWLPWTALAAGLFVGAWLGAWLGSTERVVERGVVQQPANPGHEVDITGNIPDSRGATPDDQAKGLQKQERAGPPDSPVDERRELFEVMAFGTIEIDEPLEGRQRLENDRFWVRHRTTFQSGDSQIGVYVFANDARMRVDRETSVKLDVDSAELDFGRIWVDCGKRDLTLEVEARVGDDTPRVVVESGAAICAKSPSGLQVWSLRGYVTLVTRAQTVRLRPDEKAFYDPQVGVTEHEPIEFQGEVTSWMTNMIVMGADRTELADRVRAMVTAYETGEHRDAARREILKLGPRCVWQLADSAERNLRVDRDYAIATARLIAQIVGYWSAPYALSLLMLDDRELREIVFEGIRSRTGTDGGTTLEFWLDAPPEQRRAAIEHWAQQLR